MSRIRIKPMSVNKAWQGRRYKSYDYVKYTEEVLSLLPVMKVPEGKLSISLEFGFSNSCSDWDNGIKPFCDILQLMYNFNDKMIYKAKVEKKIVKKGEEYIDFTIKSIK